MYDMFAPLSNFIREYTVNMASLAGEDWRSRLNDHPFCRDLREQNAGESGKSCRRAASEELLAVRNGDLYVWNAHSSHLVCVNLKMVMNDGEDPNGRERETRRHQILACSNAPSFVVERILINKVCQHIAIWGPKGVMVLELPKRWGKYARFEGFKEEVTCCNYLVAGELFASDVDLSLCHLSWHPGSAADSHIVLLTSNNTISIYDINEPGVVYQTIVMRDVENVVAVPSPKLNFQVVLGECAVSFDFGKPLQINLQMGYPRKRTVWPLYILKGNGDILFAYSDVSERTFNYTVMGPLPVHPPAADNYGTDACAILCLPTVPPVIVMATCDRKLHHCIELKQSNNENTDFPEDVPCKLLQESSLFVYESIELELSLTTFSPETNEVVSDDDFSCRPIRLERDPYAEDRYHCVHDAGVHTVAMPWILHYQEFCTNEKMSLSTLDALPNQNSVVEHLICTKPLPSSSPSPVLGVCVSADHVLEPTLVSLTADYEFITIPLGTHYRLSPLSLATSTQSFPSLISSPIKQLVKEPFRQHISHILQRKTSNPLLKSGKNSTFNEQECFQLLTRSTQVFREQYIQKQDLAFAEIKKRGTLLICEKDYQMKQLRELEKKTAKLRSVSQTVAEKCEQCHDKQDEILKRLEFLVRKIQSMLSFLSDAEIKMCKDLKDMEAKLHLLKKLLKETKAKQKYQSYQIKQKELAPGVNLQNTELANIKDILQMESSHIAELMAKVRNLKLDV